MKPLLSIIVLNINEDHRMFAALLSRLSLNSAVFPDHTFEVISVSNFKDPVFREISSKFNNIWKTKNKFIQLDCEINKAHMANVGLRFSEGDIVTVIYDSFWPGENFVFGALNPFIDDLDFRVTFTNSKLSSPVECMEYLNNSFSINHEKNILNLGAVYRIAGLPNQGVIQDALLNVANYDKRILSIINNLQIKSGPPMDTFLDSNLFSVNRKYLISINGFNENMKNIANTLYNLIVNIDSRKMKNFDNQTNNFCSIDCSPFIDKGNWSNKEIKNVSNWGQVEGKFTSYRNGFIMTAEEHEKYIKENIKDVPSYAS